jgi:hypothetical protein
LGGAVVIEEPLVDLAGLLFKDTGYYHTGNPRPIQNDGEPISNPNFAYSLDFPRSRFYPRICDWSSTFNFQFDLSFWSVLKLYEAGSPPTYYRRIVAR